MQRKEVQQILATNGGMIKNTQAGVSQRPADEGLAQTNIAQLQVGK